LFFASFPPAGIVILVAAVAALALGRIYLSQLATYIQNNREDFVCAIYDSETAGDAIDAFLTQIDNGIESLSLEVPLPSAIRQVVNALCDANVFAKVYDVAFEVFYPDADCSGCASEIECEPEDHWAHNQNQYTRISENVWDVVADGPNSGYHLNMSFIGNYNKVIESIEVISGSCGIAANSYCGFWQCIDGEYENTYSFNETGGGSETLIEKLNSQLPERISYIYSAYSGGPYTVRVTLAGDCEDCSDGDILRGGVTLERYISDLKGKGINPGKLYNSLVDESA